MQKNILGIPTAAAVGLVAMTGLTEIALAGEGNEYRVIGCDAAEVLPPAPPPPPGTPADFVVVSSFSSDEIGLPCEAVLTALGEQGFRLVDAFIRSEFIDPMRSLGVLHYLERSNDEDD